MPEVRVQDEQGNIHVFPDGSTPEMISKAMGLTPTPTATISAQPAFGTWPYFKQKFYQAVDATANALPGAGATIGGVVGSEGGPIGTVGGAGIGGMAGSAGKHLLRRAVGFEESNDPNAVAQDITKEGAVQGAVQGVAEGLPLVAGPLAKSSLAQYKRALAPTTKPMKAVVNEVAPDMLNRGVHGNLESIEEQAGDQAAALKPKLDATYAALPPSLTKGAGAKVIADLDGLKNQYIVAGKVANPEAVNAISGVQDIVRQYGNDINPEDLRSLRQIFDEPVAKANGYAGADLSTHYTLNAKEAAANSMRRILNSASPDVAALNKEISFWLDVQKVAHESGLRQTGQQGGLLKSLAPLGTSTAAALGLASQGAQVSAESAVGTFLATHAAMAMRTPAWRTASAVLKNRFATALASGDVGDVLALSARFGIAAPATIQNSSQSAQRAQP